ncbi:polyphosphate glucokinase [Corynebacterium yudongzhengii]|uniref:ROK family protein n=1 Tax=Corynebacterium yudongzhengii TaxID=2080740 RepID=A0A2U1T4W6_9CORY|nr:ROK family protein [Corynebacterium yudongzhengii]AWB81775.1 polyphosphate glucokinase [Corynebacterium yudongzhengii]PWC01040.1 ROK family protein [Corynebacterium yudongzhengii]
MDADAATKALGIDVGGSGIKGAIVDLKTGEFFTDRHKIATPHASTPDAVATVITAIVEHFEWEGPVGITLPAVVRDEIVTTAANIDKSWIGTNVATLFARHLPEREVSVLNDADAAGLAEVEFGHPKAGEGAVVFLTFGTGIGSALLIDGSLFPNTEFGHLLIDGREAEHFASSAVRDRENLGYAEWATRVDKVLAEYERLLNPTSFIVGGGISRNHEQWVPLLRTSVPVLPAKLRNRAGIVGAAMAVAKHLHP